MQLVHLHHMHVLPVTPSTIVNQMLYSAQNNNLQSNIHKYLTHCIMFSTVKLSLHKHVGFIQIQSQLLTKDTALLQPYEMFCML